jgi:hypothetical protein
MAEPGGQGQTGRAPPLPGHSVGAGRHGVDCAIPARPLSAGRTQPAPGPAGTGTSRTSASNITPSACPAGLAHQVRIRRERREPAPRQFKLSCAGPETLYIPGFRPALRRQARHKSGLASAYCALSAGRGLLTTCTETHNFCSHQMALRNRVIKMMRPRGRRLLSLVFTWRISRGLLTLCVSVANRVRALCNGL